MSCVLRCSPTSSPVASQGKSLGELSNEELLEEFKRRSLPIPAETHQAEPRQHSTPNHKPREHETCTEHQKELQEEQRAGQDTKAASDGCAFPLQNPSCCRPLSVYDKCLVCAAAYLVQPLEASLATRPSWRGSGTGCLPAVVMALSSRARQAMPRVRTWVWSRSQQR